jgi:hypothetical protein
MSIPPGTDTQQEHGLTREEQEFLRGEAPPERRIERRRPGWLVVGMVWATFGLYVIFWVGLNWAESKRQLRDDRMYPVWHALAMLVPIYSFFRFHANFRVMNELLDTTRAEHRVRPMLAIATFILASLLVAVPIEDRVLQTLNMMAAIGALSWIIHHGQTGMNAYWDATPHTKTVENVKLWERLLVAFGAFLWSLMIVGIFVDPTR